jgi:hypothetical protein
VLEMRGAIWHCSLSSSILSLEMAPLLNIQLDVGNYGVHRVEDERDRGRIRTLSFCVGDVGTRYLALQLMLFICV